MNSADAGSRPDIQVIAGGSLRVNGPLPLEDARGGSIETRSAYSLCRCGQSSKKPFCDGSHKGAGFTGEETADKGGIRDRWKVYEGESITIYDDRSVCSHEGVCTDDLPHCYRPGQEPWIVPDAEQAVEKQIDIVRRCPSGAISYSPGGSDEIVEEEKDPGVTVTRDGPLAVVGRAGAEISGRGILRDARPRRALPVRGVQEQALLRRQALVHRLQGRIARFSHKKHRAGEPRHRAASGRGLGADRRIRPRRWSDAGSGLSLHPQTVGGES